MDHHRIQLQSYKFDAYNPLHQVQIPENQQQNNDNTWTKIWQKGPYGNKSQKWDIYRERKT